MAITDSPQSISVARLAEWLAEGRTFQILDVRRAPAFEKSPTVIAGAQRVLPQDVEAWSQRQDSIGRVVAYCVYGHEVSQGAASTLRAQGYDALFLDGGIDAWQLQGMPTVARAT